MTDDFGHYLAGLTDGEGCFVIGSTPHGYRCEFIIHLRADDRPLLETLRDETGLGRVYIGRRNRQGGDQPSFRWAVQRRGECLRLLTIFERFPLMSKKARDFVLWAEAVRAWSRQDFARMAELHAALRAARTFESAGDDWEIEPDPQLEMETIS